MLLVTVGNQHQMHYRGIAMTYSMIRRAVVIAAAVSGIAAFSQSRAQSTPTAGDEAEMPEEPLLMGEYSDNEWKAIAVIESLPTGDPTAIEAYIDPDTYIQHNLGFASGRQTLIDALPTLQEAGGTVTIHRVLEDGDLVALHSEYDLFGAPTIGFDVFRFQDGKIVEHWDNLQEAVTETASGRSMIDGPTEITDLDQTEANKALVQGLVEDVLMGKAPERIADYISADTYAQHNPDIADGLEGVTSAFAALAEQGITLRYDTLHHVVGEGNFVLTMAEGEFGGKPTAFYDLFRVEDGKVVEHWDVLETIPPQEEWQNENGKF
jgi:predicted SnoaL-like aldol condensation-catalyzing enzyme